MKRAALAFSLALIAPFVMSGSSLSAQRTSSAKKLDIQTLSTHADRLTGGDVPIAIAIPPGAAAAATPPDVRLNGRDVASAFRLQNRRFVGLVTGLVDGRNELKVSGWGVRDQPLAITNYPITGPVISGPQQQPFVCQTDTFKLPDGTTLTDARLTASRSGDDCSAATKVQYVYMPYDGKELRPLADTRELPANVATITTTAGKKVPFVVRVETGTMNRGI